MGCYHNTSSAVHLRSSPARTPDGLRHLFPVRSTPGLLTQAPQGGLLAAPVSRQRKANPTFSLVKGFASQFARPRQLLLLNTKVGFHLLYSIQPNCVRLIHGTPTLSLGAKSLAKCSKTAIRYMRCYALF
jgi:hypothetical protein